MAVFDFPNTPAVGDLFTDPTSGAAYTWNGYAWIGGGGNSLGALVVQDAPPTSPADNSLWYESDTGMLFLRYNDGNSSQWVQLNALPSGAGYATIPFVNSSIINSNRLINGNMRVDQRNGGVSSTVTGAYTADRWRYNGAVANKLSWQRTTLGAAGLAIGYGNALNFTSSSSYASAANEAFIIFQPIEADMVTDFAWGTPNAQPVTLSFWAVSSLAGTFSGCFKNAAIDRSYPFIYTLPVANVWTKIAVTIPGDTAGTWALSGNALALYVQFDLGSGTNFRSPAGAWAAGNFCGATGAVSLIATNAATLGLTGVKLEVGTVATTFPIDSLAKQLSDCQRYYQSFYGVIASILANGSFGGTVLTNNYTTIMRATPTIAFPSVLPGGGFVGTMIAQNQSNSRCSFASNSVQTSASAYVSFTATLDAEL